jgi:hypothetical protein
MPTTNIVRDIRTSVDTKLLPVVPKKWIHQFNFGFQAYGLTPFQSAASNARSVVQNPATASTKTERLLANAALADSFGYIIDQLNLVKPSSFVSIDHSDMHGLTALVGAVQTRKGRALPVMVETTYALQIPAHSPSPSKQKLRAAMVRARRTQSFTGHTIDALQDFANRLGFWPKLVFDRGFGNESIIEHLHSAGAIFYIRMKAGRYVEYDREQIEIKQLKDKDTTIELFGLRLRVIRSPKSRRAREPWFILTNDFRSSRSKIIKVYYHRFEIEETFKDIKHIWEYKRTRLRKPNSLKVLLWFVCIGIALLYQATKPTKQLYTGNTKKQTSWLRQAYEQYQRACGSLVWSERSGG